MGQAMMNALTVLLVWLAAASAVPVHFPHEKTVIYKYHADVKAGTIEPVPYASQFAIDGLLHVKHDTTDPTLKNAYYVTLTDVRYGLHNGQATHHERIEVMHPIMEAAKIIQDPFLIVYDENGKFQGVKLMENESGWSKNIKQAIASMLQLDLSTIQMQTTPVKPHAFITMENTIHGTCQVAYNVQPKDKLRPEMNNVFIVTKIHDPSNCTHYVQRVFNRVECDECQEKPVKPMTASSRRVFEIENQGDQILIKKLVGHGVVNYFPWNARSEAHYVLNNQTLILEKVVPVTTVQLPLVNFEGLPIIRDVTFNKPQGNYALHAGEDLTQGRHIVKLDVLIPKLKKMLGEAADYLQENHLEMKDPDWKHGQTISRLLHTMTYMDVGSLEQVYNAIQDAKTQREVTIKRVFLEMVPNVGTTATCHFTRNVIRKHKVSDVQAISMLKSLAMSVRVPSETLLLSMEDLIKLGDTVSPSVKKASILCFATLIHRVYKDQESKVQPWTTEHPAVDRYLDHFLEHIKLEPTYEMKMVYMMAIKNVGMTNTIRILEPIIRGELVVPDKPHHIRVQAIWAIKKLVTRHSNYAHDLLWPVLTDTTLPLPVRIAAYDVLVTHLTVMGRAMNLHWVMVTERNEHLYNYHLTTMKSLSNTVDPCLRPVREMARKILRFTRVRPVTGLNLSMKHIVDIIDPVYGHGESWRTGLVFDELTGMPQAGSIEHFVVVGRKTVNNIGIHWSSSGLEEILKFPKKEILGWTVHGSLTKETVKVLLNTAAKDMPPRKDVHLDICITINDNVVLAHHYDKSNWLKLAGDLTSAMNMFTNVQVNWQQIIYRDLYEVQVPTDMGLSAVFATKMPNLMSLRMNNKRGQLPNLGHFQIDARIWQHGEHVMSIYNPIADVWHSVRRVLANDVIMPVEMKVGIDTTANSLKIILPRLPVTNLSVGGWLNHVKDYVTVTEDETDVLKQSCVTCHHLEIVTKGTVEKKYNKYIVNSKDAGLQYLMAIFDCENKVTPIMRIKEFIRSMSEEHMSTWGNKLTQIVLGLRQFTANEVFSPPVGSCGTLFKMEPSVLHPVSQIEINVRASVEDLEHTQEKMHVLPSRKINVRGTVNVMTALTNVTLRAWDVNLNVDMSPGHVSNNLKLRVTRITPGEKNLKMCVDAHRSYPVEDVDPLNHESITPEVNSKVTISVGQTNEEHCVRDDTLITMTVKSEMSPEQKKQLVADNLHSECVKEIQTLRFPKVHVPKTDSCIRKAIMYTTQRLYTVNISQKKVPQSVLLRDKMVEDIVRAVFLPHVRYTWNRAEADTTKITVEYPVSTSNAEVSVTTPEHSYELTELPFGDPLWNVLMDNTHFSLQMLNQYTSNKIKTCTVYPEVLVTADNSTMPHVLPSQWTLMSGDYLDHTFAVFVRSIEGTDKVGMKMFFADHEIEVTTTDTQPQVVIDGNVVQNIEKGVTVPPEQQRTYDIRITHNFDHLFIQTPLDVMVVYTPYGVSMVLNTDLQGRVTGVCGHLDGTHKETMPKVYTVTQI